jgi:hypothetical protein
MESIYGVVFRDHHPPPQKSMSVRTEVITNTNAQNQAQPDFPSRALISINSPHTSDINAMKANVDSRSRSDRR